MFTQLDALERAVREEMARQDPAHDFHHVERVCKMAGLIAEEEGGNKTLIYLAALVHDVGDRKAHGSEAAGKEATRRVLEKSGFNRLLCEEVADIAHRVSFKGIGVPDDMPTLEGKIVQDADRLDAIGAIAIARTFTWGGAKGRPIHVPGAPLVMASDPEQYYAHGGATSINHFHEKLLHLKGRLHTNTAKRIGELRHQRMLMFLEWFEGEWNGRV